MKYYVKNKQKIDMLFLSSDKEYIGSSNCLKQNQISMFSCNIPFLATPALFNPINFSF